MVTVKDVKEIDWVLDCNVEILGEDVPFEEASFGWSGPLDAVPEFLDELPVEKISQSFKAYEEGSLKFYLYVPLDKLKVAFTEPGLLFSEESEVE